MKKEIVYLVIFLVVINFVFVTADELINESQSQSDVEQLQEDIDTYVPINESGEFDPSEYKSMAEIRIEKINVWLEGNAKIFNVLFGVVPAISWYFALILYLWLWALVVFVLNHKKNLHNRILSFGMGDTSFYLGIAIFVLIVVTRLPKLISDFAFEVLVWGDAWYYSAIRFGLFVFVSLVIIMILNTWGKYRIKKEEESKKAEERVDQEALKRLTNNMLKR